MYLASYDCFVLIIFPSAVLSLLFPSERSATQVVVSNLKAQLGSTRGPPHGRVVKFVCSTLVAQGFPGWDPGHRHGTAHQAMLRQRPT